MNDDDINRVTVRVWLTQFVMFSSEWQGVHRIGSGKYAYDGIAMQAAQPE